MYSTKIKGIILVAILSLSVRLAPIVFMTKAS